MRFGEAAMHGCEVRRHGSGDTRRLVMHVFYATMHGPRGAYVPDAVREKSVGGQRNAWEPRR